MPVLSGLIDDRERAICVRFREFRAGSGLTQEEFATLFDLTRAQVAAIEGATTPLRYHLADRICQRFNLSQRWLATGKPPMLGHVEIPLEIGLEIGASVLLSVAFDSRIHSTVDKAIEANEHLKRAIAKNPDLPAQLLEDRFYALGRMFDLIPPHLHADLFGELMSVASAFYHKNLPKIPLEKRTPEKKLLTASSEKHRNEAMKPIPSLKEVLEAVKKATAERGQRAALARRFKISEASLSEWLREVSEPGGAITLRLWKWVCESKRDH